MSDSINIYDLEKLSRGIVFGQELLEKIVKEQQLDTEKFVVVMMYRKLLEQVDGNFVLADHKVESASMVLVRAALETYLSLSYILQEKRRIKDRASCYYVYYLKQQLDVIEFTIQKGYAESDLVELKNKAERIDEILSSNRYKRIVNEGGRTKQALNLKYEPKWYSYFNGPKNLKQLTDKVRDPEFEIYNFYGLLSTEAHGYQALNGTICEDDEMLLKPIRNEDGVFQEGVTSSLLNSATLKIVQNLFPSYFKMFTSFAQEIGIAPRFGFKVILGNVE